MPDGLSWQIAEDRERLDEPLRPQAFLNADQRDGGAVGGKPSLSIDNAALQHLLKHSLDAGGFLVDNSPWGGVRGQAATVTYAFRANAPDAMPDDATGFSRFNATQIQMAEQALAGWSDVANITFQRVGAGTAGEGAYSDAASILFGNYSDGVDGASAFGFYPGSRQAGSDAGDVWVNSGIASNAVPVLWDYGPHVLAHEIGHAIGLSHPGDYNADAGAEITYQADAEYYEDSRQYSLMSYFGSVNTGGLLSHFSAAPQLDDIRAAQILYGANMSTRTGDTVYGFNSNADRPWFILHNSSESLVAAVWDAGGNDTFDFSGYASSETIDLRDGFFTSAGVSTDVGAFGELLRGNIAIAQGTIIENAIGGSGSDIIHGNAVANRVFGGSGNDTIDGGTGGANYLRGDDGNDIITGGADFDDINGNMGADVAHGALGDDWVVGGKDDDNLFGDEGGDIVYGNLGADTCDGGVGNDLVRGGQGADILAGGAGDDWLSGDRGDDTITGGAGADTFHGSQDAGIDRITDFNLGEGDRVTFDPGTTYTITQQGADVVIAMSPGNQMVLVGVQLSSLGSNWIV